MLPFSRWRPSAGFLLLVGTGIIWGTIGIAAKYVYLGSDLDPISVSWLRSVIASPVCVYMAWRALGRDLLEISRRDFGIMALLGAMLIVYQYLYLEAILKIGISAATLISLCGAPVLVVLASTIFLHEPLTGRISLALTGAMLGTAFIVGWQTGADDSPRNTVLGVLFAIGSALGVATHVFVSRLIAGNHHAWRPLAIGFPAGALVFLPVVLIRGMSFQIDVSAWGWLVFLGLGPSVLGYWMYQRGLQDVSATDASIVTLLEPLVAALLAAFLFGERLGALGWVGAALLLGSIALLTVTSKPRPRRDIATIPLETVQ